MRDQMRDHKIDILRFIGLAMIIFAHVVDNKIWFQIRNFDVPLMVLVSGASFGLSYKKSTPYLSYIWKRIKRLLFPMWIFLTFYFPIQMLFFDNEFSFKKIIRSYALIDGIGYVWIFRVFLLVAVVAPLLYLNNEKHRSNVRYFLMLSICLFFYEVFRHLSLPHIHGWMGDIISLIVYYTIAYSLVFALGLRMPALSKSQVIQLAIVGFFAFLSIAIMLFLIRGELVQTQNFKYPPSTYYLSYAIFVSSILWIFSAKIEKILDNIKLKSLVLFMAQNSLWIYLWHIPFVSPLKTASTTSFWLEYIILISLSTLIAYCQIWTVKNILMKFISNDRLKKNLKGLLTG